MAKSFKLKSGNKPSFKMMGSSPIKQTSTGLETPGADAILKRTQDFKDKQSEKEYLRKEALKKAPWSEEVKEKHKEQYDTGQVDKDGNPHMIPIQLPHGDNGQMKTINIPVITLVPHNGMAIKEVEIEMQVALSQGESEEINKSKATKKKPSRIYRFFTDLSKRNKGREMAKIKVKFNGQDAPEGLARIKDSLIKIIPN